VGDTDINAFINRGNSTVAGVQLCKHRLLANTAGNAVAVIRDRLATSPVDYIMY